MVKNIKKLIEQTAKEKDLPERAVERALKNAIAIAIKKDKNIKDYLDVEFENGEIKVYIISKKGKKRIPLDITTEDVNRIAAYAAKKEFLKEIEQAERERGFLEYKELEGEIITGIVRKIMESGDMLVDLGKVDAILPKREQIQKEKYKPGDRIKTLLLEVRRGKGRPAIILSRTHPKFLKKLIESEIPEVNSGYIEVKAVAREPGERAKVAVHAEDLKMDPVGIVVGLKGSRIQPITEELSGEKIDVIRWSEDFKEFLKRALSPSHPTKIKLIPDEKKVEVAVPKEELSLAIGKRGVNVKLANKLIGWHIDVMSEEDFEKLESLRQNE